jgi:hypothetical protein
MIIFDLLLFVEGSAALLSQLSRAERCCAPSLSHFQGPWIIRPAVGTPALLSTPMLQSVRHGAACSRVGQGDLGRPRESRCGLVDPEKGARNIVPCAYRPSGRGSPEPWPNCPMVSVHVYQWKS